MWHWSAGLQAVLGSRNNELVTALESQTRAQPYSPFSESLFIVIPTSMYTTSPPAGEMD